MACVPNPGMDYSDAANVARADLIFTAHVFRTEEVPSPGTDDQIVIKSEFDRGWVNVSYRLLEPIKGDIPAQGIIATVFNDCNGTTLPGGNYIFFVNSNDGKKRLEVAGFLSGTRMIHMQSDESTEYVDAIKKLVNVKADSHK